MLNSHEHLAVAYEETLKAVEHHRGWRRVAKIMKALLRVALYVSALGFTLAEALVVVDAIDITEIHGLKLVVGLGIAGGYTVFVAVVCLWLITVGLRKNTALAELVLKAEQAQQPVGSAAEHLASDCVEVFREQLQMTAFERVGALIEELEESGPVTLESVVRALCGYGQELVGAERDAWQALARYLEIPYLTSAGDLFDRAVCEGYSPLTLIKRLLAG
jgi:hypothetical protein